MGMLNQRSKKSANLFIKFDIEIQRLDDNKLIQFF